MPPFWPGSVLVAPNVPGCWSMSSNSEDSRAVSGTIQNSSK
jgi:hypothetical protein